MRLLVVGHTGMLGSDVMAELDRRGIEANGLSFPEFDITDPMACAQIAAAKFGKFDWVVNCAAYTAVDKAESEVDEATKVNALGPSYLARACAISQTRLLHVSTDFVFDGRKTEPYTEEDSPNPLGVYGRTKLEGELAVRQAGGQAVVVRTAWLYGVNGNSFPRTMLKAWLEGKRLRVVSDQTGSPTSTVDLARILVDLMQKDPEPGVFHAAGPEAMTWHELAVRTLSAYKRVFHDDRTFGVEAIRTSDWPTPAPRPAYSVLSSSRVLSFEIEDMRDVDASLEEFVGRAGITDNG